jgi:hypothetical protein
MEMVLPKKNLEKFREKFRSQFATKKNGAKIDSVSLHTDEGATFSVYFYDWALKHYLNFFVEFCAEEKIPFKNPRIS